MSPSRTPTSGTSRPHNHEETTVTTTETPLHIRQAEGLRALADMIEKNPEVAEFASLDHLYAFHVDSAKDHATMIRAALKAGAKVDKKISDDLYNVVLRFGLVGAWVLASRNEVCEQVGTKTVTKTVKDPEALKAVPEIEVTEEVPVWECKPLLAAGTDAEAVAR